MCCAVSITKIGIYLPQKKQPRQWRGQGPHRQRRRGRTHSANVHVAHLQGKSPDPYAACGRKVGSGAAQVKNPIPSTAGHTHGLPFLFSADREQKLHNALADVKTRTQAKVLAESFTNGSLRRKLICMSGWPHRGRLWPLGRVPRVPAP